MLHPATQVQDSMAFMPARGETSISNTNFDPPKIASREEKQAAQKLLANSNNSPISLSAIGIGLLSLVTIHVVRLRRGLQPATILASSDGLGFDMPMYTKSALGDNVMEMKSQDSNVKVNSGRVGWGQQSFETANDSVLASAPLPATAADLGEEPAEVTLIGAGLGGFPRRMWAPMAPLAIGAAT